MPKMQSAAAEMKMTIVKRFFSIILLLMVCFAAASAFSACRGNDPPPDDPTSAPVPVYGEYVAEYSTLTFNPNHLLHLDISEDFSKKSGLPAGKNDGTYVFLYRNEEWRYDKAETLRITVDGVDYTFQNAVGTTNSKTLAFYLPDGSMISFDKTEE